MLIVSAEEITRAMNVVEDARRSLEKHLRTYEIALKRSKIAPNPDTHLPLHDLDNAVDILKRTLTRKASPAANTPTCGAPSPLGGNACMRERDHSGPHQNASGQNGWYIETPAPVAMILHCPMCHARHLDKGEFATKPHHTHACQSCGHCWRPAIVPTVGVPFLPGFKDKE